MNNRDDSAAKELWSYLIFSSNFLHQKQFKKILLYLISRKFSKNTNKKKTLINHLQLSKGYFKYTHRYKLKETEGLV